MKLTALHPKIHFEKKWPDLLAGILLAATFVLGGMLLAQWIWLFFAPTVPAPPLTQEQPTSTQANTIISAHWFRETNEKISIGTVPSINFQLVGIFTTTGNQQGFAIFKLADSKQRSVLLHQEIIPGIRLLSIKQKEVEIGQEGSVLSLALPKDTY